MLINDVHVLDIMDREELLSVLAPEVRDRIDRVEEMYNAPFARMMGIEPVSIKKDEVVCTMELKPEHLNSHGIGHGAAVYALVDHAFAFATNIDKDATGVNCDIRYHRPAKGRLTARTRIVNGSRSLDVIEVNVYGEEGKLVASSTCTSFVLKRD